LDAKIGRPIRDAGAGALTPTGDRSMKEKPRFMKVGLFTNLKVDAITPREVGTAAKIDKIGGKGDRRPAAGARARP
jgi:hypothetical protein